MTENPQTPEGQPGDPAAEQRTGGTNNAPTERIPGVAASSETPVTSPTGPASPAEHQLPQAPGVAPAAAPGSGAAFGPAATAQYPTADYSHGQQASADSGQPGSPKTSRRRIALPLIGALAIGAIIGGGSGAGIYALANGGSDRTQTVSTQTAPNVVVNRSENATTVPAVAAKSSPSVVTISVAGGQSAGTGSGIVLNKDGYVLTNTHVVTLDGATADAKIQVTMSDGRIYSATVVGTDPIVDLAVIKLDGATNLTPMTFADSSDLNVGDSAIAIGAPLGLSGTVTDGIVSALNRSITVASSAVPDTQGDDTNGQGGDNNSQGPFDFWNFDMPGQGNSNTTAS